jgi:copper chaperone
VIFPPYIGIVNLNPQRTDRMKTIELKIEGMTCGHCVMSVKKALARVPGASVQSAVIGSAVVTIDEAAVEEQALVDAVGDAGYDVSAVVDRGAAQAQA